MKYVNSIIIGLALLSNTFCLANPAEKDNTEPANDKLAPADSKLKQRANQQEREERKAKRTAIRQAANQTITQPLE